MIRYDPFSTKEYAGGIFVFQGTLNDSIAYGDLKNVCLLQNTTGQSALIMQSSSEINYQSLHIKGIVHLISHTMAKVNLVCCFSGTVYVAENIDDGGQVT